MADNITNTAAFATANMKPAAAGGENIDAVWGRNIADNTGYNFWRKTPGPGYSDRINGGGADLANAGTHYVNHRREWPYLTGSFTLKGTASVTVTAHGTILVNGVVAFGTSINLTAAGGVLTASGSFVYDKSALTHDTDYKVVFKHNLGASLGAAEYINTSFDVDTWQSPT